MELLELYQQFPALAIAVLGYLVGRNTKRISQTKEDLSDLKKELKPILDFK